MLNCTTQRAAVAAAACLLGVAPLAHAATLEMRVDGGFVTGTLLGLGVGETLSFDTSGSFADGGGALVSLSTDRVAGQARLMGHLQLNNPALLNSAATTSWKQFAVAGVVGSAPNTGNAANPATSVINFTVVFAPGPYRTSRLFANGSLLESVDVLGAAVTPVPEPSTWALMLMGLAGLARCKRMAHGSPPHQPG